MTQTKTKIGLTFISRFLMKKPKSNSVQRKVERLIFLNLDRLTDRVDTRVVF